MPHTFSFSNLEALFCMDTPFSVRDVTPLSEGRIRFMPLQMENIHTHFRWNNDAELNRLDSEAPHQEESFGSFKQRFERLCREESPTHRHFEIHDTVDEVLIGVAYVADISPHHRHALVGVTIGEREYWGEGYGRESLRLLLQYCFRTLDLHRVSAETFEYNTAWRDLVDGLGFTQEGVAREYLYRDGEFWDKHLYAMLAREYRQHVDTPGETAAPEAAA